MAGEESNAIRPSQTSRLRPRDQRFANRPMGGMPACTMSHRARGASAADDKPFDQCLPVWRIENVIKII